MPALRARRAAALILTCALTLGSAAHAQSEGGWGWLGWANLTTNDATGDGQDRWQSFSTSTSFVFGPKGATQAPTRPGRLFEFRLGTQIAAPANTRTPAPGDRRLAGVLRAGLHTHFARGGWDMSVGAGVEGVGPATRIIALQDRVHRLLNADRVAPGVMGNQIGNAIFPMGQAELAYSFAVDDAITIRPYASLRGGLESYARAGFDVLIGSGYDRGVLARDYVTGQLYSSYNADNGPGVSLLFGADVARVFNSALLPSPAYGRTPVRGRVRGGVLVEDSWFSVFYGATYLTPEFQGQPGGQTVGSVQLRLKF